MDYSRAVNIAVGCVIATDMPTKIKQQLVEQLRKFESTIDEIRQDLKRQFIENSDSEFAAGWNSALDAIGSKLDELTKEE